MIPFPDELRIAKRTVRICILLAVVFVGLGINELGSKQTDSFGSGFSGLLQTLLYAAFGTAGLCAFWIMLAVPPLVLARWVWQATPRAPSNRWYRD